MEKPKFNIGDNVWFAHTKLVQRAVNCPDCCGQRAVTIIFGDGSQVSVDCGGCYPGGFEPSYGTVKRSEWRSDPICGVVIGIDQDHFSVGWSYTVQEDCRYTMKESDLFLTKSEAAFRAGVIAKEQEAEETDKLEKRKHHERKTWAWNASYHRKCIKNAQKDLEYHTKKLAVAKVKAKEDKTDPNDKIDHGFKSQACHTKWPNEHRDGLD